MSWLKQLASKAEAALEKIDSETASVLKKETKKYPSNSSHFEHKRSSSYNQPIADRLSTVNHESRNWSASAHNSLNSSPKDLKSRKRNFDNFHNNSVSQAIVLKAKSNHSRQSSSASSFDSTYIPAHERESPTPYDTSVDSGHVGSVGAAEGLQNLYPSSTSSSVSATYSDGPTAQDAYSVTASSVNECEMLRKELVSLNQDMQQVLRRAKEAERDSGKLKSQLSAARDRQSQSDALLGEIRQRELKLQRELEKTNSEVTSKRQSEGNGISGITNDDNQRSSAMTTATNGTAAEELHNLKQKFEEANLNLEENKNTTIQLRAQFSARLSEMEDNQNATNDDLAIWRQRFESETLTSSKYAQQVTSLSSEMVDCRREFDDYKAKAGRILKEKQNLFDNLVQNKDGEAGYTMDALYQREIDLIKSERDLLQEQLDNYGKIIRNMKTEAVEVELNSQKAIDRVACRLSDVDNDLVRRKEELALSKEQKNRAEQELGHLQEESVKVKNTLNKRVAERDEEIDKLQKQISHKISSSIGTDELENRIHSLTESLILKQNTIEAITTEKHTLSIQCEKLQEQYAESQKILNTDVKIYVDDYRNSNQSFMSESPFDGGVTRRVKKAYSSVGKSSLRLGAFLRRYPVARLFILMYMGLLHVWVMIVLLTYTPEIHANTHTNG